MKKYLLTSLYIGLTMIISAQSNYDNVNRKEYYIIKTGTDVKSSSTPEASKIINKQIALSQFGKNISESTEFDEMLGSNYTKIVFEKGLVLHLPERQSSNLDFEITSDTYSILLNNGKVIKVGMKASELEVIFPKAYLNRKVSRVYGEKGKVTFFVNFSFIRDGKLILEDSGIIFILSKENGVLEKFFSYNP